jgi:hypothetical protein
MVFGSQKIYTTFALEKSYLKAFHNFICKFFGQNKAVLIFEYKYKGRATSTQTTFTSSLFLAIKVDTLAVPHHISTKLSHGFNLHNLFILSKSFFLLGTKGAKDIPPRAIGKISIKKKIFKIIFKLSI